jgi:hypothetical protein
MISMSLLVTYLGREVLLWRPRLIGSWNPSSGMKSSSLNPADRLRSPVVLPWPVAALSPWNSASCRDQSRSPSPA